jgi:hypothetical protein
VAVPCNGLVEPKAGKRELQVDLATCANLLNVTFKGFETTNRARALGAKADAVSRFQALGRAREGPPTVRPKPLMEQDLNPRAAGLADAHALQPRRDDPRVVEHESVAGPKQIRQGGQRGVRESAPSRHVKKSGCVPRHGGTQRNSVFRQVEVEEIDPHGRS